MTSLTVVCKKSLWVSVAVLLVCLPLFSQGSQGTIQGGVFDQTGGAIAGATVTIIDASRGLSRPLITDSAGEYFAANVIPGTYTVRGEAKGFQTVEHANILVEVGKNIRVDLTLQPGAQTQTITVTSEVPSIDTTDATLGGTVSNQAINALPLNGRNFQRLLQLRPGVVSAIGGGTGSESSNGLRSGENTAMVEGLVTFSQSSGGDILNSSYHEGDAVSLLPIDAIQEFNVEQNPKAEYGWRDGAIQNVGVKSGTNSIHGTAYAFGRDSALDASNYFTGGRVPITLEQYGATAGGRFIKDKFFWFFGYEDLTDTLGDSNTPTIPSDVSATAVAGQAADIVNSMVDACNNLPATNGNAAGRASVNPLSALIAGLPAGSCVPQPSTSSFENLFPNNPNPPLNGKPSTISPSISTVNPIHNGVAKLDYNLGATNHLSGMFFIGYANAVAQLDSNQLTSQWLNHQLTRVEDGTAAWVWTPNSTWVNEFRGGYAMTDLYGVAVDQHVNPADPWPTGYGINTGITNPNYYGMPKLIISAFSGFLGQGQRNGIRAPEGDANFVDHVSFLRGKHAFKFGGEVLESIRDDLNFNYGNGSVTFKTLQDFLTGTPNKGIILFGQQLVRIHAHSYAGFFQDDWRVNPRVTLNLGLRYEYNAPPVELLGNYEGNFYPNVNPATTSALGQAGGPFAPLYKGDKRDFSPRFGVAWDVQGNGKTVVRAAASIMYNQEPTGQLVDIVPFGANVPSVGYNTSGTLLNAEAPDQVTLAPNQITWSTAGPAVFPANVGFLYKGATYSGASCTYVGDPNLPNPLVNLDGSPLKPTPCSVVAATDPNFHTPYAAEWNLDIQRAITSKLTVEVAYVGNHGRAASRIDLNQPPVGWGWTAPTSNLPAALASSALPGGVSPAAYCLASASTGYNHCTAGKPAAATTAAVAANVTAGQPYYSQFPYLNQIDQTGNLWVSDYNGLQVTVTQRASHGLTFLAGYTLAHALDNHSSSSFDTGAPIDVRNERLNYATGDNDSRNRFTFSSTYAVPGIKSPGQMLQGWSISPIVSMFSGTPWSASDATTDIIGTGEFNNALTGLQPWNYSGPPSAFTSAPHNIPFLSGAAAASNAVCLSAAQAPYAGNAQLMQLAVAALTNLGCYQQGLGVLTPPAYGTIGDASRNMFRGPAFYNVDLSVAKDWKFKERYSAQFRAEIFNLFNRADFGNPRAVDPSAGGQFGCSCATPDTSGSFPNSVLGSGSPRSVQLGLKLTF